MMGKLNKTELGILRFVYVREARWLHPSNQPLPRISGMTASNLAQLLKSPNVATYELDPSADVVGSPKVENPYRNRSQNEIQHGLSNLVTEGYLLAHQSKQSGKNRKVGITYYITLKGLNALLKAKEIERTVLTDQWEAYLKACPEPEGFIPVQPSLIAPLAQDETISFRTVEQLACAHLDMSNPDVLEFLTDLRQMQEGGRNK